MSVPTIVKRVLVAVLSLQIVLLLVAFLTGKLLPSNGQIAFMPQGGGNPSLYLLDVSRQFQRRLLTGSRLQPDIVWSPDGKRLAVVQRVDGQDDVFVLDVMCESLLTPCRGLQNLTHHEAADYMPVWSPDGRGLTFVSERDNNPEIYWTNLSGSQQVNLSLSDASDTLPVWSPDGSQLAFLSDRTGFSRIFLMNVDCDVALAGCQTVPRQLSAGFGRTPVWSPDGNQLAYFAGGDIFLVDPQCKLQPADCQRSARNFTRNFYRDWRPEWSPDGKQIVFQSDQAVHPKAYIGALDCPDSCIRRLTEALDFNLFPEWSPDGKQIAMLSNDSGNMEIYVVQPDGSGVKRLTWAKDHITSFQWRPGAT